MMKKRGLGRGLESLLSDISKKPNSSTDITTSVGGDLKQILLSAIQPGKYQPRRNFTEESLNELADSIRAQGVIQPIIVRTIAEDKYEIIAGERRFRAAKLAELKTIPAIIKELPDEAVIAMALIENIQREDLNPIEEALALQRLIDEFQMTHEQVAHAVGKSRTAISNGLRLLGLENEVRELVELNYLQMGHARALLAINGSQQIATAQTVVAKDLSVRETEDLIRRLQNLKNATHIHKDPDPAIYEIQHKLAAKLGAKVLVQQSAKGQGKIVIKYKNEVELRKLLERF